MARCYEFLNDRKTAETHYQAALQSAQNASRDLLRLRILVADFYSRSPGTDPRGKKSIFKKRTRSWTSFGIPRRTCRNTPKIGCAAGKPKSPPGRDAMTTRSGLWSFWPAAEGEQQDTRPRIFAWKRGFFKPETGTRTASI